MFLGGRGTWFYWEKMLFFANLTKKGLLTETEIFKHLLNLHVFESFS